MRKKLSIALLAFSLAMLCANFLVRRVGSFLPPSEQEMEEENNFSPFTLVKQEEKNDTIANTRLLILEHKQGIEPESETEIIKPILKLELTEEEKQTVETYTKNPKMQQFIKEIYAVVPEEELDQENYLQIVYKPEVRDIFLKYSQDEDFKNIASEIMKNKDFLQLANKLINDSEVKK